MLPSINLFVVPPLAKGRNRLIIWAIRKYFDSAKDFLEIGCHFRRYEADQLSELLKSTGFEVLRMTSFVSLLLPAMILNRYLNYNKDAIEDPYAEHRIPEILNQCLYLTMCIERLGIKSGLSYPAGGSLLVVAKAG